MSESEAATTIQRHMKGFCVRRKYGPLVNSSNMLDNTTAGFIREYFDKWRTKTIFQVLVLYRASKYLEMVYFCQQVHLYNQNLVSETSPNEVTVVLHGIREDVDRKEFLGTPKLSVSKMPFRLNDLPFCDTAHMCGSVYERVKAPDEPRWDEPFISLDKSCQTQSFDELRESVTETQQNRKYDNLVNTRYTRDLKDVDKLYDTRSFTNFESESPVRRKKETSREGKNSNKARSPGYSSANLQPTRGKLNGSNSQSLILVTPSENGIIDFRKNLRPSRPIAMQDPILVEMEMKGKLRAKDDIQNEDDPPYNFQAMLRKTNHQRYTVVKAPKAILNENNDVDVMNNNQRMESKRADNCRKEVRTEILPGVFVTGHITDL